MKEIVWSNTKINTLISCPRKFQLQYLDRIKKPSKGDPLCIGSGFGKALEEFSYNDKLTLTQLMQIYDTEALDHPAVISKANIRAHRYLVSQYFSDPKNVIKPAILNGKPMVEYKLEFKVDGIKFLGYIDIVSSKGFIVDYKTAKNPYTQKDLEPFSEKGMQLTSYALGYYERFGRIPKVGFQVVIKTNPIVVQRLTSHRTMDDIKKMKSKIIECDNYIKTRTNFNRYRSYKCKFCAYHGQECTK